MAEFLVQRRRRVQFIEFAIDLNPLKPLFAQFKELFLILAFAVTHDRGQQIGAQALFHPHDAVDHILHLLRLNRQAGGRAIGRADTGEQQTQIVVNLGHGAHSRARVFRRGFLFDGNGGAETADVIHIRFFHHIKELAGIGRQALDIAALSLGIDRIKGQGRFPRPRQTRNHHQLIARNIHVDAFEVVFARAAHFDVFKFGHTGPRSQWDTHS